MTWRRAMALLLTAVVFAACNRPVTQFWIGLTDPAASTELATYERNKAKLKGMTYAEVTELLGPGKFGGPTLDSDAYLFSWSGTKPMDGGLTVKCNPRGIVIEHYWVMP